MDCRWDIGPLAVLADRVRNLASVPSRLAIRVADALPSLFQAEFSAGEDPYGEPWAPLAPATLANGRHHPPLTDSGTMRSSLTIVPVGPSTIVGSIDHPARPHQTGWSGPQGSGPARPIVPTHGTPPAWEERIEQIAAEELGHA